MDTLKKWFVDFPYNSVIYDSKFVGMLLREVFGKKILSKSSLYGNHSNLVKRIHDQLNTDKIKFVQGISSTRIQKNGWICIFFRIYKNLAKFVSTLRLYFAILDYFLLDSQIWPKIAQVFTQSIRLCLF